MSGFLDKIPTDQPTESELKAQLNEATETSKRASEKLEEHADKIKDAKENASEDVDKSLNTFMDSMKDLKAFAQQIKNDLENVEEEDKDSTTAQQLKNLASKLNSSCDNSLNAQNKAHSNEISQIINNYINDRLNNTKTHIKNYEKQMILLNEIMNSKNLLNKGFEKDLNLKNTLNDKNKNYIITTQRLSQFYSRNINTQTSINNILKIILIVLSISTVFLLKEEIKKSFIKPLVPTIISLVGFSVYMIYLFINKNIHEISPLIIISILIFVIFIQYSTIKLQTVQSPYTPVLFGVALVPYLLLFIIEKLNLEHNIIPIHDKNTKLSFKINEDIKNLKLDNENLEMILSKYKEYQDEYE